MHCCNKGNTHIPIPCLLSIARKIYQQHASTLCPDFCFSQGPRHYPLLQEGHISAVHDTWCVAALVYSLHTSICLSAVVFPSSLESARSVVCTGTSSRHSNPHAQSTLHSSRLVQPPPAHVHKVCAFYRHNTQQEVPLIELCW